MALTCIVMAAGRGTRLKASLPKMLLPLDGRSLVTHPVATALRLKDCEVVVVVGHQREAVKRALLAELPGQPVRFAVQRKQRGTGDAVAAGLRQVRGRQGSVLILSGDVPLLTARTLGRLRRLREGRNASLTLLTMRLDDPGHYGRVIRQGLKVQRVVEHVDASAAQRAVQEVNAGIYCVELGFLRRQIKRLGADNKQGELYLTDLVAAADRHQGALSLRCDAQEVQGINTWAELSSVAKLLQERVAQRLMASGVHLERPDRVVIHSSVRVGPDTVLGAGVELTGRTRVGRGCRLEAGVVLRDCRLGDDVHIKPYSVLEGVRLRSGERLGPHTHRTQGADHK